MQVPEDKEKTVQKTYRLPESDVAFVDALAKKGILGVTGSAVMRTLITYAIKDLIEKDFVKKTLETRKLLQTKKKRGSSRT